LAVVRPWKSMAPREFNLSVPTIREPRTLCARVAAVTARDVSLLESDRALGRGVAPARRHRAGPRPRDSSRSPPASIICRRATPRPAASLLAKGLAKLSGDVPAALADLPVASFAREVARLLAELELPNGGTPDPTRLEL
jgi:hypothetical protein